MKFPALAIVVSTASLLAACSNKPPPPLSVSEFLENPILLEATIVLCAQNRSKTKYEAECVNAREASSRMAVVDEEARRKEQEAQFERKRKALRRTQVAAAEARRRALEARRKREEDEYLGVFEPVAGTDVDLAASSNSVANPPTGDGAAGLEGSNQPGMSVAPAEVEEAPSGVESPTETADIDSIREELKRRQDTTG